MMSVEKAEFTLNRAQRRKQETRERLIVSAEALLSEMGYNPLTVRAITEHADLGYGTFYLYFDNVDDVVGIVLERMANSAIDRITTHFNLESPRRRVYLMWVHMFSVVEKMGELFLEMFGQGGSAQLVQDYQYWLAQAHESSMGSAVYPAHSNVPLSFQAQYTAGAIFRVQCWWAENGFLYSPEAMAAMLYEMTYHEEPPQGRTVTPNPVPRLTSS